MKIIKIETFHADAGWRPWTFIKIFTDQQGLVGWSECSDSHGSPRGIGGVVKDLESILIGRDPREVEKLYWFMYSRTRQSPGSIIQKAIGGIENALLDVKAKALGVPVYELFGGLLRDKLPLYWSHCGDTRVRYSQMVQKPQIKTFDDVLKFGEAVKASGFRAIKPKLMFLGENPEVYMPGFARSDGWPELNVDADMLKKFDEGVGVFRKAIGEDIELILDLNFNFKQEGFVKVGRMLEKYNPMWLELDVFDPKVLRVVKDSVRIPIASGEDFYGGRAYLPFFDRGAMDIAITNVSWNGFIRSKQIADVAEMREINLAPHNHNGHLATFISAQFCASIPNFRIMEVDVDDVPWKDELFTNIPKIEQGVMDVPKGPGWGTEVNEEVLKKHPWPK